MPWQPEVEPISALIQRRRTELGLSRAGLGDLLGRLDRPTVSYNEVARWENGRRIPRPRARRILAEALGVSAVLLDQAATAERARRNRKPASADELVSSDRRVEAIRAALLDLSGSEFRTRPVPASGEPPDVGALRRELSITMEAYQSSRYSLMLDRLPSLLRRAQLAVTAADARQQKEAMPVLALAAQATAMLLTKLGHLDLAWAAADRGLAVAERCNDEAVFGSLCRSVVHTLQSHGRTESAIRMTEQATGLLGSKIEKSSVRLLSVYGTLLLAGAMAAARAGDKDAVNAYLEEATVRSRKVGRDANHLWTAFGPTNVAIHKVSTSVALGDIDGAKAAANAVVPAGLPLERRVRYTFDVVRLMIETGQTEAALHELLNAERLAPEQVQGHIIGRQLVMTLRSTSTGRRSHALKGLAQRINAFEAAASVQSPG